MIEPIARFYQDIRLKFANIESGLGGLQDRIERKADTAEHEVRDYLERTSRSKRGDEAEFEDSRALINRWRDELETATGAQITEWKANKSLGRLRERADKAERYAIAVTDIAAAALENAQQAALLAWLARHDAKAAESKLVLRVIDGQRQMRPDKERSSKP